MRNKTSKSLTSTKQQLEDITTQLEALQIEYNNKRKKLLDQRIKLISEKKNERILTSKSTTNSKVIATEKHNTFKIGQRVKIINNYSGDYGESGKGIIGIVYQVNKIQVSLKSESNQKYYTRSYKNLLLIE
jgi:regulator of replication initiation timing